MQLPVELIAYQARLHSAHCRIVPTSFDAEDASVGGFPLPFSWEWKSCADALIELEPQGVMMRLPLFWQLEVPLWEAARNAGAPIFLCDPENMPLGSAALARGGMDTVVSASPDASTFLAHVRDEKAPEPRAWVVIHSPEDTSYDSELSGVVAHEVHLFPGLPILIQCARLIASHSPSPKFHLAEGIELLQDGTALRTAQQNDVPSFTLPLPIKLQSDGTCTCSQPLYRKV